MGEVHQPESLERSGWFGYREANGVQLVLTVNIARRPAEQPCSRLHRSAEGNHIRTRGMCSWQQSICQSYCCNLARRLQTAINRQKMY